MPIYEFECCKCGQKFEYLMLSANDKAPECPACHGGDVRKLMSAGCKLAVNSGGEFGGATAPSCHPGG